MFIKWVELVLKSSNTFIFDTNTTLYNTFANSTFQIELIMGKTTLLTPGPSDPLNNKFVE